MYFIIINYCNYFAILNGWGDEGKSLSLTFVLIDNKFKILYLNIILRKNMFLNSWAFKNPIQKILCSSLLLNISFAVSYLSYSYYF